jgi:hypothetical protein
MILPLFFHYFKHLVGTLENFYHTFYNFLHLIFLLILSFSGIPMSLSLLEHSFLPYFSKMSFGIKFLKNSFSFIFYHFSWFFFSWYFHFRYLTSKIPFCHPLILHVLCTLFLFQRLYLLFLSRGLLMFYLLFILP